MTQIYRSTPKGFKPAYGPLRKSEKKAKTKKSSGYVDYVRLRQEELNREISRYLHLAGGNRIV